MVHIHKSITSQAQYIKIVEDMLGYDILAQSLAAQNIQHTFGIVGIPVIELGFAIQSAGINYYGFRNEQQAAYTAGYCGFLNGMPAVCLCVSGPAHTNALSGIMNAWTNSWPMILISGASDLGLASKGAFQELDQVYFVKPYTKYSAKITDAADIPYHVEKAVKLALVGRPGPVYLDLPGDVLMQTAKEKLVFPKFVKPAIYYPDPKQVSKAVATLKQAKKPLIIIGKGAAYSHAENEVTALVNNTGIPFLPMPMGKGVVPDSNQLNISPARSLALRQADAIILIGAKLNWMLHFGLPPRFSTGVKIVQIDICPEEHGHNVEAQARLIGDCRVCVGALVEGLKGWKTTQKQWVQKLLTKASDNVKINKKLIDQDGPLNHYSSMGTIAKYLPKQHILIGEGSSTMDIGRTIFTHEQPRRKMDAATFGTMGIGSAACISAQVIEPQLWTIAVMGDSAFGFSAMEFQTLTRYKLGTVVFIINNNGIVNGTDSLQGGPKDISVTHLNPDSKYELLAEAFGGKGYSISTKKQIEQVCREIFSDVKNKKKLFVVNVHIDPNSFKKPQEGTWLTRKDPQAKL